MTVASTLSIVVPMHRLAGRTENLYSWLANPKLSGTEIILVHDASDGESVAEIENFSRNLSNVIILEGNFRSPGLSRNLGLEIASRSWIAFWDFDDKPNVENFLVMLKETIDGETNIGVGSYQIQSSQNGELLGRRVIRSTSSDESHPSLLINPGLWRWVFRREFIGAARFISNMRGEDQYFLFQIQAHNQKLSICEKIVYSYFVGGNEQTSDAKRFDSDLLKTAMLLTKTGDYISANTRKFAAVASLILMVSYLKRNRRRIDGRKLYFIFSNSIKVIFANPSVPLYLWKSRRNFGIKSSNFGLKTINVYFAGGLGNQLFQLAFALNIKDVDHFRLICPSLEVKELIKRGLLTKAFSDDSKVIVTYQESLGWIELRVRNLLIRISTKQRTLNQTSHFLMQSLISFFGRLLSVDGDVILPNGVGFDPHLNLNAKAESQIVIGYFQSYKWAEPLRNPLLEILRMFLKESPEIEAIAARCEQRSSILLQIRLGDYLDRKNSHLGHIDSTYVSKGLSRMREEIVNSKLLVFTNDEYHCLEMLASIQEFDFELIPSNITTLQNLALLSIGCRYLISNSTFGWWGAFLSGGSKKVVIIPQPWFKNIDDSIDFIPDNWIGVEFGDYA